MGSFAGSSYGELHAETCRLANALASLGIGQGDAVGLFLPMIPEAVIAFLACAKIGAIAVPIFSGFGAQAVAARLADCGAKAVITVDASFRRGHRIDMEPVAAEAAAACPSLRHVIVAGATGAAIEATPPCAGIAWIGTNSSAPRRRSGRRRRSIRKRP